MAGEGSARKPEPLLRQPKKLPKLPENARVHKRPLHRPPIPSKHSSPSHQKVVYISKRTPFVAAVKRVRKLLALADKRAVQSKLDRQGRRPGALKGKERDSILEAASTVVDKTEQEEVWVKATGKCISKALQLAVFFQGQEDCKVRMRTGSVWAVEDVEMPCPNTQHEEGGEGEQEHEEIPDTRLKQISMLEVAVSLR